MCIEQQIRLISEGSRDIEENSALLLQRQLTFYNILNRNCYFKL